MHLGRHLGAHHPLHGHLVDQALRRVGGQDRVQAVGAATHVDRRSQLVDGALIGRQLRFGGVQCRAGRRRASVSASVCACTFLSRSSWAECIASVSCSACRESSLSLATASSAGSANAEVVQTPARTRQAGDRRRSIDLMTIGFSQGRAVKLQDFASFDCRRLNSPKCRLGLDKVTKRHRLCPTVRAEMSRKHQSHQSHQSPPACQVTRGQPARSRLSVPTHRNQPQPGRQTRLGEHLQCRPLVLQQGLGHSQQDADHTVPATRAPYRAVVAINDHRLTRVGTCRIGPSSCLLVLDWQAAR